MPDRTPAVRPSVAVIGSGVAGLTAAYLLRRTHDVTLLERSDRLGGHAHTHTVTDSAGSTHRVDSGFIVHNLQTYPQLLRLFAELGVRTQPTEMSMSITCNGCGLSYAGGRGARGVLAQRRRVVSPRFVSMLTEVPRFHRRARALLAEPGTQPTWSEFLADGGFSAYFVSHFAIPLVSCVWSMGDHGAGDYPARHLFEFLDRHGMLSLGGSPTWRTVVGGSGSYVDALSEALPAVRTATAVRAVERHDDGVDVRTDDDHVITYDRVVLATHADQALDVLVDASPVEKGLLGAIRYSVNDTWLHRDSTALPRRGQARASWNYRMLACGEKHPSVQVSYWMNRLQGLTASDDFVVTLNPQAPVAEDLVIARMRYEHPIFTTQAVEAAAELRSAGGDRLAFAGAHLGWGFHEDGCRSGVEAAARFGTHW